MHRGTAHRWRPGEGWQSKAKRSEALASDTNCHAVLSAMVFESAYLRTIPSGRADSMRTAKKAIAGVCDRARACVCVCVCARVCVWSGRIVEDR